MLILLIVITVDLNELIQALKICQAHSGRDLVHFAVDSDGVDLVVAAEAKVFHPAQLKGQGVIVGGHCAAFQCIDKLGRMKAEHLRISEVADHPSVV